jgi:hypothetical protein
VLSLKIEESYRAASIILENRRWGDGLDGTFDGGGRGRDGFDRAGGGLYNLRSSANPLQSPGQIGLLIEAAGDWSRGVVVSASERCGNEDRVESIQRRTGSSWNCWFDCHFQAARFSNNK